MYKIFLNQILVSKIKFQKLFKDLFALLSLQLIIASFKMVFNTQIFETFAISKRLYINQLRF